MSVFGVAYIDLASFTYATSWISSLREIKVMITIGGLVGKLDAVSITSRQNGYSDNVQSIAGTTCDALCESQKISPKVKEGEVGDTFFIIAEGECEVLRRRIS